jgi:hypothetical protein
MTTSHPSGRIILLLSLFASWLAGCSSTQTATPAPLPSTISLPLISETPAASQTPTELTDDQLATLESLEKLDDHPLYSMRYHGDYTQATFLERKRMVSAPSTVIGWGCSLFAAFADPQSQVYGRNFDWRPSPALLLFTDPPGGYASVSMVDIEYLGFGGGRAQDITSLPLSQRRALLDAPGLPFDGMNEHGLVVGMAAVPESNMQPDPAKETIGSLGVIREMLDHARDVEQALTILQSYNIDFEGGPPLHYLIVDASGVAALVEFYQERMHVIYNEAPWHQATNFLVASASESPQGLCWRYDQISQRLSQKRGAISPSEAMALLSQVAQDNTQWSIVYGMSTGEIRLAMGKRFDQFYTFGAWK